MTQLNYQTVPGTLPFNSQRGGLIAFGVVFILIGLVLLLGALSLPLAILVSQQQFDWLMLLPLEIMYLAWAGIFVFAGIENIRARRWVRPAGIVCGLLGIIGGVIASVAFAIQWSQIQNSITAQNTNNPGAAVGATIGLAVGLVFVVILYIILPGLMLWFYRRPAVLQTVLYYDRTPSWTDDKPLVLIAAILIEFTCVATMPVMMMYGVFPMFTTLIKGAVAMALHLVLVVGHGASAILLMKRHESGIWLAMSLVVFQMASTAVALAKHGYNAVFAQPQFVTSPGAVSFQPPEPNLTMIYVLWGIMLLAWCAFLLHVRSKLKVIVPPPAGEAASV